MVVVPTMVYPVTLFVQLIAIAVTRDPRIRGIRASSWLRTSAKQRELNELGRGVPRSLHERGLAMDLIGQPAQVSAMRSAWLAYGLDAVDEVDHLHIELDGPALRRLGVRFI